MGSAGKPEIWMARVPRYSGWSVQRSVGPTDQAGQYAALLLSFWISSGQLVGGVIFGPQVDKPRSGWAKFCGRHLFPQFFAAFC